jgi:hypothetical protein
MLTLLNFAILYVLFLIAELWILANTVGNRLHGSPGIIRAIIIIALVALPALGAIAILTAPNVDLPDSY